MNYSITWKKKPMQGKMTPSLFLSTGRVTSSADLVHMGRSSNSFLTWARDELSFLSSTERSAPGRGLDGNGLTSVNGIRCVWFFLEGLGPTMLERLE